MSTRLIPNVEVIKAPPKAKKASKKVEFNPEPCLSCPLKLQQGQNLNFRHPQGGWRDTIRKEIAPIIPIGLMSSPVVYVGDAPYPVDFESDVYFKATEHLFYPGFESQGIPARNHIILPALRCYIDKKTAPKADEKAALSLCRNKLIADLQRIQPMVIVAFGDYALRQVLKTSGITNKRGTFIWSEEFTCWVFPMLSPMNIQIDESKRMFWNADIRQLSSFIENGYAVPDAQHNKEMRTVESIDFLLEQKNFKVALDTETQGAKWHDPQSRLISYSVTDQVGKGYNVFLYKEVDEGQPYDEVILWERKTGRTVEVVPVYIKKEANYDQKLAELTELLERPDIKIVMMNGNYDLHRFRTVGIDRDRVKGYYFDIQTAAHTLDPDNFKKASMRDISRAWKPGAFDHKTAFADTGDKGDMFLSAKQNEPAYVEYACDDASETLDLANILQAELSRDMARVNYYSKLAHPVQSEICYEIEKNGIVFDVEGLPKVKEEIATILREKERAFLSKVPAAVLRAHQRLGTKLTRGDFIRDVFYSNEGFGLTAFNKTKTGAPGTDRKGLIQLRDGLGDGHPAKEPLSIIIEWGPYNKLYSTYLKGFGDAVCADGRLHPQISKVGTATARTAMCIRKGSMVETVRDVAKYPLGTPIEEVVPGDYVYSFDDSGMPTVKKVVWAGHTGRKSLVRVHFRNQKNTLVNFLDLTPEHEVRLSTGKYVKAGNLKQGMSVCSVSRGIGTDGYSKIYLTNKKGVTEHRFIYEQVFGQLAEGLHVHHLDRNKCNQNVGNLMPVSNSEHKHIHLGEDEPTVRKNALCRAYTRGELLRMLAKAKGCPTKMGHDFDCIKNALMTHDINWESVAKRYNRKGEYLSRGAVLNSLCMPQTQAQKFLSVGTIRWNELIAFYGFSRPRKWANQFGAFTPHLNNHEVISVEVLNVVDDVYDLEVEGTHNFVVNGISVHNSKPNLQCIPKRNPVIAKALRKLMKAAPGKMLVAADASQAELRYITHESGDAVMTDVYMNGQDIHSRTAEMLILMSGQRIEDLSKEEMKAYRTKAKAVNFGLTFGMSAKKFQAYARDEYGVHLTVVEAEAFHAGFFSLYSSLHGWHEKKISFARAHGFTRSLLGFTRLTPNINSSDFMKRGEDERVSINTSIQSASNDTVLLAALTMKRRKLYDPSRAQLSLFIHDELIYEVEDRYVSEFIPILLHSMENPPLEEMFGFKLSVPLVSDAKFGYNLAEMEEYVRN